ncbi:hypothetical protein B0H13DRAFT_2674443 [Mycena leptocephala]|nr:hypothetical protein B0H13DRAFT_2674443 [Mycena leptocephala]
MVQRWVPVRAESADGRGNASEVGKAMLGINGGLGENLDLVLARKLPLVFVVLTSHFVSSCLGWTPSATPPTKTSLAAAPSPAPAHDHNSPKACTPPTQIQIYKDTTPTRINITRPRQRTTPIRTHTRTRTHTSRIHNGSTPSIQAQSLRPPYQPAIPVPAPDRPADAQGLTPAQAYQVQAAMF